MENRYKICNRCSEMLQRYIADQDLQIRNAYGDVESFSTDKREEIKTRLENEVNRLALFAHLVIFLYPLKDYNMNLQSTLLYKITILDSYTILLERYPEEQKAMTTPRPIEHRDLLITRCTLIHLIMCTPEVVQNEDDIFCLHFCSFWCICQQIPTSLWHCVVYLTDKLTSRTVLF